MSDAQYELLTWQETKNGVTIDCSLDVAVHPAESNVIFVTIPGVDGSVDGYKNKYVDIANSVQGRHHAAVVRASNPFITSFHWESNLRNLLAYIRDNAERISGTATPGLYIMAHSAGAAITAQIAHEYPQIKRLLLVNIASKLGMSKILVGLSSFNGEQIAIVYGEHDPSITSINDFKQLKTKTIKTVHTLPGIDHNFSSDTGLESFKQLPLQHFFETQNQ